MLAEYIQIENMGNKQNIQRSRKNDLSKSKSSLRENVQPNQTQRKDESNKCRDLKHITKSSDCSTDFGSESAYSGKLTREVKDAVAEALSHSNTISTEQSLMSSGSGSSKCASAENQAALANNISRESSMDMRKKKEGVLMYSPAKLRSLKLKVMQGTLRDLQVGTSSKKNDKQFGVVPKKQVAFAVDETVCGLVIGKGGVNVKKLEKTFDVEIIVNAKKSETATKRIVTILGVNHNNIEKARRALDYQQVFIPILGIHQKKLIAQQSEDKFQKWRMDSGVVRIEFETELENYDPSTYQKNQNQNFNPVNFPSYKQSSRDLIRQKKEESNDLHSGFLRLVGTKESVVRGQKMIEEELDRVNKASGVTPAATQNPREEEVRVHNVETNYSRVAAHGLHNPSLRQKGGYYRQPDMQNPSAIYQLWQQQQQQVQSYPYSGYGYNPYRNYSPYVPPQTGYSNSNSQNFYRGYGSSSRRRSLKYSRAQKSLDDMLLGGKLSVDEYASKLSKHSSKR